jgi:hypothetical protein
MPECVRCGAFTDNPAPGEYHYCGDCRDRFAKIEANGVIVEQSTDRDYRVIVTADAADHTGGTEPTQTQALARGKYIADNAGVDAMFKYEPTGSRWVLSTYLDAHPEIRQEVHERLRRVPADERGLLARLRRLFR